MIKGLYNLVTKFLQAAKEKRFKQSLQIFYELSKKHRRQLMTDFHFVTEQAKFRSHPYIDNLKRTTQGLHALLNKDQKYSYSILYVVESGHNLQSSLESALDQAAELLIGYHKDETGFLARIQQQYPSKVRLFPFTTWTELAAQSTSTHLFLLQEGDEMRPDLLYRYEQMLRLIDDPQTVLHGRPLLQEAKKEIHLPYEFTPFELYGVLIPRHMAGNLPFSSYSLTLALDLQSAKFIFVDVPLYHSQGHSSSGELTFQDYIKSKGLDWTVEPGRIRPSLKSTPQIHVVIPFKDQIALTLQAVRSIQKSKGVQVFITAVDNNSSTSTQELKNLGCEVMRIEEPFNYSRLNNLAVKNSIYRDRTDLIFFMNNDAELDEEALLEMSRWAYQPNLGLIGCRLHFPHGTIQHGGVKRIQGYEEDISWVHNDWNIPYEDAGLAKQLHVADAVTCAAALIRRTLFEEVGGFDEILYPIAYSDTHLALKLKLKGYLSFYTPFATGIHHESLTRSSRSIEDFERSKFLHEVALEFLCTSNYFKIYK